MNDLSSSFKTVAELETLPDTQVIQILSDKNTVWEIAENGDEIWLTEKLDTLQDDQVTQILSSDSAVEGLTDNEQAEWVQKKQAEIKVSQDSQTQVTAKPSLSPSAM